MSHFSTKPTSTDEFTLIDSLLGLAVSGANQAVVKLTSTTFGNATFSMSGGGTWGSITGTLSAQTDLQTALNAKQVTLISGTNIKTINSTSILGSGNIVVAGSSPLTTKGDVYVYSSADDRLGVGTDGYILSADSAQSTGLKWIANSGGGATTALDNLASVAINAALVLGTSDAFALGSATKMWSDLFLASGAVINFNNGAVTLTHSASVLTMAGGALVVSNSATATDFLLSDGGSSADPSFRTTGDPELGIYFTGTTLVGFAASGSSLGTFNTSGFQVGASGARISSFSTDGTLASNADTLVPTQKAVKTYADTKLSTLTIASTTITSGTSTRILYDNAGVLGEYTITGSGTVVAMQTSPVFVTDITTPIAKLSGTSNQLVFQSAGVTGTISWAPSSGNKTITLPNGTTDFTATGGTGQYLKQVSAGAAITVGTIPASDIASGAALTKTDDTNVTLTLGGTPSTALLVAASLTLGWTGTLSGTRGGTGVNNGAKTFTYLKNISLTAADDTGVYTLPTGTVTLAGLSTTQTFTGINTFTPIARSSGVASYLTINAPADTGQTTATESKGINIVGATRTWVDGTVVTQREYFFGAPTYNKTTTSATFTTAATLAVAAAPTAGTGVTITNAYALWVQAGKAQFDGGVTASTITDSALTLGSIPFAGTAGLLSQDTGLFWENTNKQLGLGPNHATAPFWGVNNVPIAAASSNVSYYSAGIQNQDTGNSSTTDWFCSADNDNSTLIGHYTDMGIYGSGFVANTAGNIKTISLSAGGSGYTAGDTITITTGDANGTVTVLTVNGSGVILTITLLFNGSGYATGSSIATTGGTGTGATINILALLDTSAYAANDGYLFNSGGNLVISTDTSGKVIKFTTGGYGSTNLRVTMSDLAVTTAENVSYALVAALSADGKYSGISESGTADATLAFGDVCYFKTSNSRWALAKADSATTSGGVKLGICVLASTSGNATTMLTYGKIRADAKFPTFTVGANVYLSAATAGVVVAGATSGTTGQPSATDQVIRVMGMADTADQLFFNPSGDYITHT